jgi:uncharacterized protein YoaH (UPF0181 family)
MSYLLKQKVVAQIHELMEKGMTAEEIAKKLQSDREKSFEPPDSDEEFASEIKTVSQAFAFRRGNEHDIPEIFNLLNSAYQCEVKGDEKFRAGEAMTMESVMDLFSDETYRWLVMEAPNGFEDETDGLMLGVSCFTTDGVSRRNGNILGWSLYMFQFMLSSRFA